MCMVTRMAGYRMQRTALSAACLEFSLLFLAAPQPPLLPDFRVPKHHTLPFPFTTALTISLLALPWA
jgi:hypothetical protein